MKELNLKIDPDFYDALCQEDRNLLMNKEVEFERDFGISRLTDDQELRFKNAKSAEKQIYRLPFYDMLYNQRYRNMFEWNQ